jgi:hypothetical protein
MVSLTPQIFRRPIFLTLLVKGGLVMKKLYSLKGIACILKVQDSYDVIKSLEKMAQIFKREALTSSENGAANFFQEKDKIHTILLKGMVNEEPLRFKVKDGEVKILQEWQDRNPN